MRERERESRERARKRERQSDEDKEIGKIKKERKKYRESNIQREKSVLGIY